MNGEGPGGVCPFPKGYECKQTLVISHLCGASNEFKKFLLKRFHLLQLVLRFLSVFLNTASVNSDLKILNRPIGLRCRSLIVRSCWNFEITPPTISSPSGRESSACNLLAYRLRISSRPLCWKMSTLLPLPDQCLPLQNGSSGLLVSPLQDSFATEMLPRPVEGP